MTKYEVTGARINEHARAEICRVLRDTADEAFAARTAMLKAGYAARVKLVNIGRWTPPPVKP